MPTDVMWKCIGESPSTAHSPPQPLYNRRSQPARHITATCYPQHEDHPDPPACRRAGTAVSCW
jgi:hypothetical protein